MPDPIFERYKEALRAGHVAALRGRLDDALINYRRAAAIADERALPHASMAGVLLRLGRVDEAAAAYSRAVERAPDDEAALAGRAEALIAAGKSAEAAQALDRLAEVYEAAGRPAEALTALRRAFDLVQTGKRRNRVKGLQQAVRAQLEAAAAAPPRLPAALPDAEDAASEHETVEPATPSTGEPALRAIADVDEVGASSGAERHIVRGRATAHEYTATTARVDVAPTTAARASIAWPASDRRPVAGPAGSDLGDPVRSGPRPQEMAGVFDTPGAGPEWSGSPTPGPLHAPGSVPPAAADGQGASAPPGEADAVAPAGTVAAARAEPAPREVEGVARDDQPSPATSEELPAPEDTSPRPTREAIEWPVADLAQRQSSRRPPASGATSAAAGRSGSSRSGHGAPEQDSLQARDPEPGRPGASMGRGSRSTEELIGIERVPALGSEPEQRFQAAEHAEATGARETAVWMYVQAADGFAARDGSQAALDACHRALAVSPRSADAHLALVRLYVTLGWRERAAEKLLLLDRLLELDHVPADRERVAAMAAEMFADDLRFPRTPPPA